MIFDACPDLPAVSGAPVLVTARCSGVECVLRSSAFTAAPFSRSNLTAAGLRKRTARWSGVTPFLSVSFTSAPERISKRITAPCLRESGAWAEAAARSRPSTLVLGPSALARRRRSSPKAYFTRSILDGMVAPIIRFAAEPIQVQPRRRFWPASTGTCRLGLRRWLPLRLLVIFFHRQEKPGAVAVRQVNLLVPIRSRCWGKSRKDDLHPVFAMFQSIEDELTIRSVTASWTALCPAGKVSHHSAAGISPVHLSVDL